MIWSCSIGCKTKAGAIWTAEGWLSLAALVDGSSRRVVGWAMAAVRDALLVEAA